MTDEKHLEERLALLQRAQDLQQLQSSPGWRHLQVMLRGWLLDLLTKLRLSPTDPEALDTLRRWQLAEELVDKLEYTIQGAINAVTEIQGSFTMNDALLMEKMNVQQSTSGDTGTIDPTGH